MEKQQLVNVLLPTVIGILIGSSSCYFRFSVFWSWICYTVAIINVILIYYRSLKITQIEGRGVVITGCANGFGHELAKSLHGMGFTVFAGCRNDSSDGAFTLKKLGAKTGRLHVIQMDVTSQREVDAALAYVKRHLPELGLWGLVNNAGCTCLGFAEWLPIENYKKTADVNNRGVVRVTNAFLPLIRQYQGRIVNVGSLLGRLPTMYSSGYCISKFGVEAFSDILRLEMTRFNVGVSIIEPGNFMSATAIMNDAYQSCRRLWNQLDESVRKDYGGEDMIDTIIGATELVVKTFSIKDANPAVNAMEAALIRRYPKSRYFVASLMEKTFAFIYQFFPASVHDFMGINFNRTLVRALKSGGATS